MKSGRIETDPVYRRQRAQNRRHSAPIAYSELPRQLTDTVTVTDTRMERIPCRARWSLKRLGAHADARCACVIDEEKTKKRKNDRSMSIVAEAEQIRSRRNSPLSSKA
jgi:N-acyl-L-homoserine lactone synthetase